MEQKVGKGGVVCSRRHRRSIHKARISQNPLETSPKGHFFEKIDFRVGLICVTVTRPANQTWRLRHPPPTIAFIELEGPVFALAALTLLKLVANCRSWKRSLFCSPEFAADQEGTGGPWLGILAVPEPNSRASMGWKKHS